MERRLDRVFCVERRPAEDWTLDPRACDKSVSCGDAADAEKHLRALRASA
jgi:hypothetical protein